VQVVIGPLKARLSVLAVMVTFDLTT